MGIHNPLNRIRGSLDTVSWPMHSTAVDLPEGVQSLPVWPGAPAMEPLERRLMLSGTLLPPGTQVIAADPDGSTLVFAAAAEDMDFGDAPGPYPTTLASDGARHTPAGPTLGTNRDAEADGAPTTAADGDDSTGTPDDEDGVTFGSPIMVG